MIGYALGKDAIRYVRAVTQVDSYIMAIAYTSSGASTMECIIPILYYI